LRGQCRVSVPCPSKRTDFPFHSWHTKIKLAMLENLLQKQERAIYSECPMMSNQTERGAVI